MKILILGAGAVGGYLGAKLTQSGADVTFLVREKRDQQLRSRGGIVLEDPDGTQTVIDCKRMTSDEDTLKTPLRFDLIIVACKAYSLDSALDSIDRFVHPNISILPLLNGMSHFQVLKQRYPDANVWGGYCGIVATLTEEGVIKRMTHHQYYKFGMLEGGRVSLRMEEFSSLLEASGVDGGLVDPITVAIWDKWTFLTTLAASTSLFGGTIGDIMETKYGRECVRGMLDECLAVAKANGIEPDLDGRQSHFTTVLFNNPNGRLLKASLARDLDNGYPTEADHIVGDMIQKAKQHQIPTPLLQMAYTRLQVYEKGRVSG